LTNISKKSNDFYKRFEIQLKESQNWPGSYMFKFIIRSNLEDLDKLKVILLDYKGNLNIKSSDKGNYKSISFESFFDSPSEIISIYKKVASLDNIISL
tara:strand:+ start:557 stop:850 length:294 start_codon:yes stop_codon:yes gene_type:complete